MNILLKNTREQFGWIAIFFHWIIAISIITLICVGLYMTNLAISEEKLKLYGAHKAFGITVLALVTLRFIWRLSNPIPTLAKLPLWEEVTARSMHYCLYLLMFMMPISGWLMTSAAGLPISFFGLLTLPTLMPPNPYWFSIFLKAHHFMAFVLIFLIAGHAAAALKHHFIDKDNILKRMLKP